jgi:hypothetical protein
MRAIERALTLWQLGLLSVKEVIAWADAEMLKSAEPPQELIDLSLDGPEKCLKRPEFEFPARPAALTYFQEFSIRAMVIPLSSDTELLDFATWMSRSAMGEDLELPEVSLAYQVDHLLNDCNEARGAIEMVRKKLPALLPQCAINADPFLEQMPNPSVKGTSRKRAAPYVER